jgi:hypothetical protein
VGRRRVEIIVAGTAILVSAGFTAAVLVWHFGLDDAWWSFPIVNDWNGFELYAWADVILLAAFVLVWLIAGLLLAIRRRRLAVSFLTPAVAIILAAGCGAIYWPFYGLFEYRVDRVLRLVKEPALAYRRLAVFLAATLVLSLLYLLVASLRRAPPLAGAWARVALVVLTGVYLHIIWTLIVLPISNRWQPAEWQRPDLLTTFQPCRGAVLWLTRGDGKIIPFGRIDDLWLQFSDPRRGGTTGRAISVETEMRVGYAWLNPAEAGAFSVRRDDPAVIVCEGRWRTEPVAPATWHTIGVSW